MKYVISAIIAIRTIGLIGCVPHLSAQDGEEVADTAIQAAACNQEAISTKQNCLDGGTETVCKTKGWDAYLKCKKEKGLP